LQFRRIIHIIVSKFAVSRKKLESAKLTDAKTSGQTSVGFEFMPIGAEKAPKGEPRYRDPANPFNTWSGRGKRPDWLRKYVEEGKLLSEFAIRTPEE
jgi:DNA-binding protein H-NS